MTTGDALARIRFETEVIHWRGPSPYFFAPASPHAAEELRRLARIVTYGWGMIPVEARIGEVVFKTALFPKDETYLVPLKDAVRRRTNVTAGDVIDIELTLQPPQRPARGRRL